MHKVSNQSKFMEYFLPTTIRAPKYILLPRTTTRINRKFPLRKVQKNVENSSPQITLLPCTTGTSGIDSLQPWRSCLRVAEMEDVFELQLISRRSLLSQSCGKQCSSWLPQSAPYDEQQPTYVILTLSHPQNISSHHHLPCSKTTVEQQLIQVSKLFSNRLPNLQSYARYS